MSDVQDTSICRTCKEEKGKEEFNKDSSTFNGVSRYCRACWVARRKLVAIRDTLDPERHERRKRRVRRWSRRNNRQRNNRFLYGIEDGEYLAMLAAQGGVCDICKGPETRKVNGKVCGLSVDHDHGTGKVRALLCNYCNSMLGKAGDSAERLRAGAAYLDRHRPAQ